MRAKGTMTAEELLEEILPAWLAVLPPRRRARVARLMKRQGPRRQVLDMLRKLLEGAQYAGDLGSLQRILLDDWLCERSGSSPSPGVRRLREHYRRVTGRAPEDDGQIHANGAFLARWPTGHDTVFLEGPITTGAQLVLVTRHGFRSSCARSRTIYEQRSGGGRAWTKAVRVVDRLAAGELAMAPPSGRRFVARMRLPKFASLRGWLDELPRVEARHAVSRYVVALARTESLEKLLAAAERDDVNALADVLRRLAAKLDDEGQQARAELVAQIAYVRYTRGQIIKGYVGIYDPVDVAGWILGHQGPYVVLQPPSQADARAHEGALRRAGFKRRGGGFAVLVGPRRDARGQPVRNVAAEAALALAREAIAPTDQDLSELGRRWAGAEVERLERDPRALGRHQLTPAAFVSELARRRLAARPRGAERSFWQGVADAAARPVDDVREKAAIASPILVGLERALARGGWRIRAFDINMPRTTARIELSRSDPRGDFLVTFDARHGRASTTRERVSTERVVVGAGGAPHNGRGRGMPVDRLRTEFIGRERHDGIRSGLRWLSDFLADNAAGPLTAGEVRRMLAPMMSPEPEDGDDDDAGDPASEVSEPEDGDEAASEASARAELRERAQEALYGPVPPLYKGLLRSALENDAAELEELVTRAEQFIARDREDTAASEAEEDARDQAAVEGILRDHGRDPERILKKWRALRRAQDARYAKRAGLRRDERTARKAHLDRALDWHARQLYLVSSAYQALTGRAPERADERRVA